MSRLKKFWTQTKQRKGSALSLLAVMLFVMIGITAMSVDVGYMYVARGQAQCAADSAALAAGGYIPSDATKAVASAQRFAGYNKVANSNVTPASVVVDFGKWDMVSRIFTATPTPGNAVRVSIQRDATHGGHIPLFIGPVLGRQYFDVSASAVAMTNPRDIMFVVDLSGSMNNDSEPAWATKEITNTFSPLGYPTVATDLMQQVYTDFNFGTFPGTLQYVGQPLGIAQDSFAYAELTKNSGPLTTTAIPTTYRIANTDSEATRKTKAYKWIIDNQLASIMPNAKPTPLSSNTTSYAYWEKYLDFIMQSQQVSSSSSKGKPRPSLPVTLPPSQDADQISGFGNPYTPSYPSANTTELYSYRNKLGYRTYVQFMMDFGPDLQPASGQYTQLSKLSPNCPWHYESTDGGTFLFPPREQPTHAARRAVIAAIALIADRNQEVTDTNQMDWVGLVTFSRASGVVLEKSLTTNYTSVMQSCVTMQAVADNDSSTATENGLLLAKNHIAPPTQGGSGRLNTNKIVVLLTDGIPNIYQSSTSTITSFKNAHPSSDWYSTSTSTYPYNAALMQVFDMQLRGYNVYMVGLGLGTDYAFMDRGARLGSTADKDGQAARSSGNPAIYEDRLKAIFNDIITNPRVRLVQ